MEKISYPGIEAQKKAHSAFVDKLVHIDIDELEKAVYHYVEFYGDGGELHERGGVATMIESMVFTKEKLKVLGLPEDALADGWWIGFHVTDESVWEKVKDGTYSMFSIEGEAIREEVESNAE